MYIFSNIFIKIVTFNLQKLRGLYGIKGSVGYMCSLVIDNILSDINISNDEKLMLIALNSLLDDEKDYIEAPYELLLKYLSSKNKVKMGKVVESLEDKHYIEVIRKMGAINRYKLIKDYFLKNNTDIKEENGIENSETRNSSNKDENASEVMASKMEENYKSTSSKIDSTSENTSSKNNGIVEVTTSKSHSTIENATSKNNSTVKNTSSENRGSIEITSSEIDSTAENTSSKNTSTTEITTSISNDNDHKIDSFKYNNINNNNNINNKLYINILNHWNSKKLGVVRVLNVKVIDCISRALTKYSEEEIIAAINNYSEVFKSKHYYNLRWTLENFLVKENGISRFCYDGDIWLSYLDLNYKEQEEDDHCLDIEQYIDG